MAKKAIEIIASEDTYKNLSTFENIDQLNKTVRAHKETFNDELNKTQIAVLDLLHRYSAKYKGVSFLTKNKIADLLGKSRRTIIRVCNRLEELDIIRQHEMKRSSDMQQTSNAIVIQPVDQPVENSHSIASDTQETVEMSHQKDNIFLKQLHNINTIRKEDTYEESYPSFIPNSFITRVKPLFPNVKEVYELYGKIRLAYLKFNLERPLEELETITITAISDAMSALKMRRIKKGYSYDALKAYLYGTAYRLFLEEKRRESVRNDPSLLINFLKTRKSKLVQKLEALSVEW
ncbi:helix-turn-helix domain-containing protein [Priestia filamentosa]|uniref:helix-turn-helix domain-containing protein n=1 Tax=Priestia filamentosa TaxID=1402861 RepID=UPI001FB3D081|nr:helix-turn-helix domain-containing protein [Priestia filamentosa]UOE62901.1 helix-turn-helix domain-containing protein [Priestia filamentosa]